MDKLAHYRQLVKQYLSDLETLVTQQVPQKGVETLCIFDEARDQYLLMNTGWRKETRVEGATLHVRLRDGKVWVEDDWTEEGIANFLVREGVPKEDIVLGFQPPSMRPYTEFAVA